MTGTIVIAGSLAQRPGIGGHTWVLLQYLLGFRRLGWKVLLLDRLEPDMCVGRDGARCSFERSFNRQYVLEVMERFGLRDAFSLDYNRGEHRVGLPRTVVLERVRQSAMLVNIMGYLDDEEVLTQSSRRVFLDIDPGFGQMWRELGLADIFRGHERFVTIGENVGQPGCEIPTCGLEWITTPPPLVLEQWPEVGGPDRGCYTSIASWRGPFGPVVYRGVSYGLRAHQFRRIAPLPGLTACAFELALDIHPDEVRDVALLDEHKWKRVNPFVVAGDPQSYRSYIQGSRAEFMVAKGMYTQTNSGWLSDRSLCYLASGRPVLAQDTGFRHRYPVGEGLIAFADLDEARAGVESIERDYARHARAARALAEEYFESDKVLGRLLAKLGIH